MNSQVIDRAVGWFLVIIVSLGIGYVGLYLLQKYVLFPAFMQANVVEVRFIDGSFVKRDPQDRISEIPCVLMPGQMGYTAEDHAAGIRFEADIFGPDWGWPLAYVQIVKTGQPDRYILLGFWSRGQTIYVDDRVEVTVQSVTQPSGSGTIDRYA